jgi:hypothetical protein
MSVSPLEVIGGECVRLAQKSTILAQVSKTRQRVRSYFCPWAAYQADY